MTLARPLPALLLALASGCGPSPSHPRNLLIVCVDTLRADELGAYGATPSRTPALDGLAAQSVVFERAHAAASWTLPSVGSLFTSEFPSTTGLWTFESRLGESFSTLAERFQSAGFRTHGIASHIYFNQEFGLQQGFDSFDDELCHRSREVGWKPITSPDVSAKAVGWLEQAANGEEPWLLFVHFFDPHLQYLDHEAERIDSTTRSERERYRSEIAFTDRHVGALLETLGRTGLAEDTGVLFFSDHGESFLEHPPIQRHSWSLYEEELRVPLFLRVPGLSPTRIEEFVRTVDLLPTLVELYGLAGSKPIAIEGVSLVPLLHGRSESIPPLLAEIRLKDEHHANALVRGSHKLIENVSTGRFELYDLREDARERRDLSTSHGALLQELQAELRARIRAAEEKGARYGSAGSVEHTPEQLQLLQDLGYAGEDEEPEQGEVKPK